MKIVNIICLLASTAVLNAKVIIKETVKQAAANRESRTFTVFNSGPVQNVFYYNKYTDPKTGTVKIGDITSQSIGLGFKNNWYSGGFLQILVNRQAVKEPAKITISGGTLRFHWQKGGLDVVLKLVFEENSDRMLGEVILSPGDKIKNLDIGFLATPGHELPKKYAFARWVSTVKNNWELTTGSAEIITPAEEYWIMTYDGKYNGHRGLGALLFDPEQIKSAKITGGGNIVRILLKVKPAIGGFRFMLWGIPESYMDAESLNIHLKNNSPKFLEYLRKFKF